MAQGRAATGAAARCDRLLDGVVVLLATWTVVYHACLVLRLGVTWAVGLEVAALATWAVLARRLSLHGEAEVAAPEQATVRPASTTRLLAGLTIVGAVVAALAMAAGAPWALVWVPWLVAAVAGTWWAARTRADRPGEAGTPPASRGPPAGGPRTDRSRARLGRRAWRCSRRSRCGRTPTTSTT